TVPSTAEPEAIPFPQADSFARVINLCEQLQDSELSVEAITENYDFTSRQTNYYTGAAKYLGLVNDTNRMWSLTDFGAKVMASERNDRNVALIKALLRHEVFHLVLDRALERGEVPDRATIVSIMEASNLELSASTVTRRAGTASSWLQWAWSRQTTAEQKIYKTTMSRNPVIASAQPAIMKKEPAAISIHGPAAKSLRRTAFVETTKAIMTNIT